jgi:ABC-type transporter Mla MlaB component
MHIGTAWHRTGQLTLRISIQESDQTIGFILEGRVAGPWVTELQRAWQELIPRLRGRKLSLDLRNVTYTDAGGKCVLCEIFTRTEAEIVASSPLTQYLANEIRMSKQTMKESERGKHA